MIIGAALYPTDYVLYGAGTTIRGDND